MFFDFSFIGGVDMTKQKHRFGFLMGLILLIYGMIGLSLGFQQGANLTSNVLSKEGLYFGFHLLIIFGGGLIVYKTK